MSDQEYCNGIMTRRQKLMEAAVRYVREGQDGTMRERLRMASGLSGISENALETVIGEVERLKANVERKTDEQ